MGCFSLPTTAAAAACAQAAWRKRGVVGTAEPTLSPTLASPGGQTQPLRCSRAVEQAADGSPERRPPRPMLLPGKPSPRHRPSSEFCAWAGYRCGLQAAPGTAEEVQSVQAGVALRPPVPEEALLAGRRPQRGLRGATLLHHLPRGVGTTRRRSSAGAGAGAMPASPTSRAGPRWPSAKEKGGTMAGTRARRAARSTRAMWLGLAQAGGSCASGARANDGDDLGRPCAADIRGDAPWGVPGPVCQGCGRAGRRARGAEARARQGAPAHARHRHHQPGGHVHAAEQARRGWLAAGLRARVRAASTRANGKELSPGRARRRRQPREDVQRAGQARRGRSARGPCGRGAGGEQAGVRRGAPAHALANAANFAGTHGKRCKLAEAAALGTEVLATSRRVLGVGHPEPRDAPRRSQPCRHAQQLGQGCGGRRAARAVQLRMAHTSTNHEGASPGELERHREASPGVAPPRVRVPLISSTVHKRGEWVQVTTFSAHHWGF